jgi:hypothetical protein
VLNINFYFAANEKMEGEMKRLLVFIFSIALFMLITNVGWAGKLTEKKLIKSANKVVEQWQAVLSKPISTATFRDGRNYWLAGKWFFSDKIKYDVKKTDSIMSPYKLIIEVGYRFGIVPPFKKNHFQSCEEALRASDSKSINQLAGADESKELILLYSIKDNNWVLTDDNKLNEFICKCCPNNSTYEKLKKMPIE